VEDLTGVFRMMRGGLQISLHAARRIGRGLSAALIGPRDHLGHYIEGAIVSGDKHEPRRKAPELIKLVERATR
jgi:hypothetical protein